MTNREAHEEAAGMGLDNSFFRISGIDPDAEYRNIPLNAPNTPGAEITRDGPYHQVSHNFGHPGATTDDGKHGAANCRKCKPAKIADPAHVCDGPRQGLYVFCADHCPKCIEFRRKSVISAPVFHAE